MRGAGPSIRAARHLRTDAPAKAFGVAKKNTKNSQSGMDIRRGLRALSTTLPKIAGPAARRRGFAETGILTDWETIIGPELARDTQPDRLRFPRGENTGGTLHLRAATGAALEIQHLEPLIIERINRFFGYQAVARLALLQTPLPVARPRPHRKSRQLSAAEEKTLQRAVEGIGEDRLKQALIRLGKAVSGSAPPAGDI